MATIADRIVTALAVAPHPLRASELADVVYAVDPDGGPLHAETIVTVAIHKMRRRGDDRVETVHDGYRLVGRQYGARPTDPRIGVIRRGRAADYSWREIADQIGITAQYAGMLARGVRSRRMVR